MALRLLKNVVKVTNLEVVKIEFCHLPILLLSSSASLAPQQMEQWRDWVRTFKQAMKAGRDDRRTLQHRLQNFLITYRSTPHATTRETPAYLFLGRDIRNRLDLIKPGLEEKIERKQAAQKESHDVHVHIRSFSPGDHVLARNRTTWCPGVVLEQIGPLSYRVKVGNKEWRHHIDLLKK